VTTSKYDAIVVGSGPNGLAAAVALAQQGLHVKVLEAKDTIGGGTRTQELTLPGFHHDVCSAIHPMAVASPYFKTLPLDEHGLEWICPEYPQSKNFFRNPSKSLAKQTALCIFASKQLTMIKALKTLDKKEQEIILQAPAMIAILIAGADDDIDQKERDEARKITKYRRLTGEPILIPYYEMVFEHFEETIYKLLRNYPAMASLRNPIIVKQLEQINDILPKLDKEFAAALYDGLKEYAHHVAKASGGFLGFFKVSSEERKWLDLNMIEDPSK
jgi:phytoene dehydrogenase-like protein